MNFWGCKLKLVCLLPELFVVFCTGADPKPTYLPPWLGGRLLNKDSKEILNVHKVQICGSSLSRSSGGESKYCMEASMLEYYQCGLGKNHGEKLHSKVFSLDTPVFYLVYHNFSN